jgi:hypothetical protein
VRFLLVALNFEFNLGYSVGSDFCNFMECYSSMLTSRYVAIFFALGALMASSLAVSETVTFDQVQSEIFDGCASSGCHGGAQMPILTAGQSYDNIVNVASRTGVDYITPGNPDLSYIMDKVLGIASSGNRMPPSGPLSVAKTDLLRDWIQQGATEGSYNGRSYHMTSDESPNKSETHIINSSAVAQSFTGNLYHKSGSPLGGANVALHTGTISSQGRVVLSAFDLQGLFKVPAWTGPAILDINSDMPFDVMSKLKRSGRVTNTNCVRSGNAQNVEGSTSPDIAYVRFINDGFTPIADIRGTLYDADGNTIGQPDVQFFAELGPREAIFKSQGAISNIIGEDWSGDASLVLSATYDNLRLMNLNFVNNEIFFNFSCYESGTTAVGPL